MSTISLSGPAELLAVLPYHLGFRPARSVVVVCLHGRQLGLVARLDLVAPEDAEGAAALTVPALLRRRPSRVTLVGYAGRGSPMGVGSDGALEDLSGVPDDPVPLLDALRDRLEAEGVPVGERILVRDGRWSGVDCPCCPPPGEPVPEAAAVPAVADYVGIGATALESREQLERLVEPLPASDPRHGPRLAQVRRQERRQERRLQSGPRFGAPPGSTPGSTPGGPPDGVLAGALAAWARLVHEGLDPEPTTAQVAALLAPLTDATVRDHVLGWLCPGLLPAPGRSGVADGPAHEATGQPCSDDADRARIERLRLARLEQLCREAPVACAAPVLAVTAAFAWWLGDGAHASVAAERALRVDPEQRLAALVGGALRVGLPPPRCA